MPTPTPTPTPTPAPAPAPQPGPSPAPGTDSRRLCGWAEYRLPADVVPEHYRVRLDLPRLGEPWHVGGHAEIDVHLDGAVGSTDCVVLHSVGIELDSVLAREKRAAGAPVASWRQGSVLKTSEEAVGQVVLEFPQEALAPGANYTLAFDFHYPLSKDLRGFYRSSYKSPSDGLEKFLGTTQFESVDARRAFPCFDEPALKATFDLQLGVAEELKALANTAEDVARRRTVEVDDPGAPGGKAQVALRTFERTPKMSTYLVAFVVGDLVSVSQTVGAHEVGIWAVPGREAQLPEALSVMSKVLPAYENLFGVPFPMRKLDLIAIPDFAAGAMENWGLITYRETALLVSAGTHSAAEVQRVAVVIAHEMAHQWFGNLVTMEWWDDLWLNEGFATMVEYLGTDAAKPQYKYLELFPSYDLTGALNIDSLQSTRALSGGEVNSASGVDSQFDAIAYNKGGSVLRMLRVYLAQRQGGGFIGETPLSDVRMDPFMAAIRSYLEKYQYRNAVYTDLWGSIEQVTGLPVSRWMSGYTKQKGYPVVKVEWSAAGPAGGTLQARQFPFSYIEGIQATCGNDPAASEEASNATWWVPLSAVNGPGVQTWTELEGCSSKVVARGFDPASQWIKFNYHQNGYYRVLYPRELYESLTKHVGHGHVSGMDVAGLMDDARAFVKSGDLGIATLLGLVDAVGAAPTHDYQAWRLALSVVDGLKTLIRGAGHAASEDVACRNDLDAWALQLLEKPLRQVGFKAAEGDSHQTVLMKSMLAKKAVEYSSTEARAFAEQLFWESVHDGLPVDPNLRRAVYQAGANANETGYDEVLRMFRNETDPALSRELVDALSSVDKFDLLARTLELSLSDDVRPQDTVYMIVDVSRSSSWGLNLAWQMVQEHFEAIAAHGGGVGAAGAGMSPLIQRVASQFAGHERRFEVHKLYMKYGERYGLVDRLMEQTAEAIENNGQWLHKNKAPLCAWVAAKAGGG